MADRSRRMRRQISDTPDDPSEPSASESEQDWTAQRSDANRRVGKTEIVKSSGVIQTKKGGDSRQSIKLTMKVAPSKLREVMRANEVDALQDTLGGGQVIDGPRSRRAAASGAARSSGRGAARPTYAEYGESDLDEDEEEEVEDEDEEEEEEEENDDDDAEAEDEELDDLTEMAAEPEGGTDDEDVEMEDAPPPLPLKKQPSQPKAPKITLKAPTGAQAKQGVKPKVVVTPAQVGPLKSVEDQEMEDELDDEEAEELSELSDDEGVTNLDETRDGEEEILEEEDAEGEDVEVDDDDDDDLDDSDDETPASGTATPDPAKLTKRQRAIDAGGLMALDMAPQQRKFFTDEEKAMKKDEHARKRKELTKRKILEEKTAALNRLLKPQASKARGAAPKPETLAAAAAAAAIEGDEVYEKADPLYTRWISTREGVKLGVPEEWLGKKVGRMFGPLLPSSNGMMVQEIE